MSDKTYTNNTQAKRDKLTGFVNWPLRSMLTQSMMIEKDIWDLISKGPWEPIAQRIITEGISDQIAVKIIDLEDPKEIWDRLKTICSEVGQGVVYSILPELLHHPAANKPKRFDKPIVEIFAEVRYLCKRIKAAMTERRDLFNTIAIVIALDTWHNDFDTTIASMLETGDKSIDEIFTIIQSKETKFKNKQSTGNIGDTSMAFRAPPHKRKATYDDLCYNCHQKRHFGRDYNLPDRRRKTDVSCRLESEQQAYNNSSARSLSRRRYRANNAMEERDEDEEPELFQPGRPATAFQATSFEKTSPKKT